MSFTDERAFYPIEQVHVTSQMRHSTETCGKNVWYCTGQIMDFIDLQL